MRLEALLWLLVYTRTGPYARLWSGNKPVGWRWMLSLACRTLVTGACHLYPMRYCETGVPMLCVGNDHGLFAVVSPSVTRRSSLGCVMSASAKKQSPASTECEHLCSRADSYGLAAPAAVRATGLTSTHVACAAPETRTAVLTCSSCQLYLCIQRSIA